MFTGCVLVRAGTRSYLHRHALVPSMNIRLDDDAYDGLVDFGRINGVSIAGLVNALGRELAEADDGRPPAWARRLIATGREVDANRRRR